MYHAADEPPMAEPALLLDAETSPVNNTIVMSAAAPTYSSDGRALVATSLAHAAREASAGEADVRDRLSRLYRTSTATWEHIASYDISHALPAMTAPHSFGKPVRHHGVYLCGDHRTTSSIQGALFSGRRAAEAVRSDLHLADPLPGSQRDM